MERSRDIPTATSIRTIPAALLDTRRRQLNEALARVRPDLKVSFTHLIGYAVARAAAEMPGMLVHFARDAEGRPVRVDGGVHLGLAVDTRRRDGSRFLVVPVLRDAGHRDFAGFRAEYERLIAGARTGSLAPDELQGASFTLTNPGGIGTMASVPRLMPGQGCIIAAGAIGYPPEYRGESAVLLAALGVGKVVTLTSTYDHRVIQGAESGEFLGRVEALLDGADRFYEVVFESLGLAPPAAAEVPGSPPAVALPAGVVSDHDRALLVAAQGATALVQAHRTHGHLGAHLDPLGTPPPGDPAMRPETYHLTPELMAQIPADVLDVHVPGRTLAEVLPNLRRTYCGTVAFEIEHISSHEQRDWLRQQIESGAYRQPLSSVEELRLLWRLTKVDAMERYFRRTFIGQRTFSGEGVDMLVPMLEKLLGLVAEDGITQVVMGMAHRGRLAVIAHVINRPYEQLLQSFEKGELRVDDPTGDVKYHLGATGTYITEREKRIDVRLVSNPSHLEAVDGVVEGWTRALQSHRDGPVLELDPEAALPLLIHGDAAFSGEGAVQEVLNLQSLAGYTTGGTVHVIVDNQLGFTTDPADLRSTRYASDLAKGFDIPIVHVNADDPEGCVTAARFAHDYRRTHHRDVLIHLVGYRRFGHNETDEPSYTQPLMYQRIREHPTVRELFVGPADPGGADHRRRGQGAVGPGLRPDHRGPPADQGAPHHPHRRGHLQRPRPGRSGRSAGAPHRGRRGRPPEGQRGAVRGSRRLHRQHQAGPPARAPEGVAGAGGDRLGPRRGAGAGLAAPRRGADPAHRAGHRARHLQPPPDGPPRRADRRRLGPDPAPGRGGRHLRGPQQPAQRGGGAQLRVRVQRRRARLPGALGGPVRRLRQQRPDGHRPVHRRGPGQVGPALAAGAAPPAWLRGAGARALERPPGTLSRALGGRQHPGRLLQQFCPVFPPPPRPGPQPDPAAAGGADPQVVAAGCRDELRCRRPHRGRVPPGHRGRPHGGSPRGGPGPPALHRQDRLGAGGPRAAGPRRRPGHRPGGPPRPAPARPDPGAVPHLPQPGEGLLGPGGAGEHGRLGPRAAAHRPAAPLRGELGVHRPAAPGRALRGVPRLPRHRAGAGPPRRAGDLARGPGPPGRLGIGAGRGTRWWRHRRPGHACHRRARRDLRARRADRPAVPTPVAPAESAAAAPRVGRRR